MVPPRRGAAGARSRVTGGAGRPSMELTSACGMLPARAACARQGRGRAYACTTHTTSASHRDERRKDRKPPHAPASLLTPVPFSSTVGFISTNRSEASADPAAEAVRLQTSSRMANKKAESNMVRACGAAHAMRARCLLRPCSTRGAHGRVVCVLCACCVCVCVCVVFVYVCVCVCLCV